MVAARSATAARTGRACVSLAANWAFGSMSSLTQLVLGSPKNHSRSGGSKSFMVNWPAVSLVFGQGALFATAGVNFPREGAERSRPPKGQVPIRPGAETQARGRPAGGSAGRAVLPFLLSERSVPRGRLRPRPGRGSAARSTHQGLDSLRGSLWDPPGCTGDPVWARASSFLQCL